MREGLRPGRLSVPKKLQGNFIYKTLARPQPRESRLHISISPYMDREQSSLLFIFIRTALPAALRQCMTLS